MKDEVSVNVPNVLIRVIHKNGEIEEDLIHNGVTQSGIQEVIKMMGGVGTTHAFTYMQIGSGTTAFSSTQTALVTEIESTTATVSIGTTSFSDDTLVLVGTFGFSTTYSVTESGVFNAATSGIMLARTTFAVKNVAKGDTLQFTWKVNA